MKRAAIIALAAAALVCGCSAEADQPEFCHRVADAAQAARNALRDGATPEMLFDVIREQKNYRMAWIVKRAMQAKPNAPDILFWGDIVKECREREAREAKAML